MCFFFIGGDIAKADEHMQKLRGKEPPVYNYNRLYEHPIPQTKPCSNQTTDETNEKQDDNEEASELNSSNNNLVNTTNESDNNTENRIETSVFVSCGIDTDGNSSLNVNVKVEKEIVELEEVDALELDRIFEENNDLQQENEAGVDISNDLSDNENVNDTQNTHEKEHSDEENENDSPNEGEIALEENVDIQNGNEINDAVENTNNAKQSNDQNDDSEDEDQIKSSMVVLHGEFPKPIRGVFDNEIILLKQENDSVSGSIPFSTEVIISNLSPIFLICLKFKYFSI